MLSAVPSLAALEQEAADAHSRAVAAGECASVGSEEWRQLGTAADGRVGGGHAGVRVIGYVAHASEVDEQGFIADAPGGPAVSAGAEGHLQAALAGEPH